MGWRRHGIKHVANELVVHHFPVDEGKLTETDREKAEQ